MKNQLGRKQLLPLLVIGVFIMALVSSCSKNEDADLRAYNISGDANGSQATPAVTTSAAGTLTGTYNPANRQFTFTSIWTNLTGTPITAGLYSGGRGVAGSPAGSAWILPSTATVTGTYDGSIILSEQQGAQLLAGDLYYLYATTINPTGEIRGQLTATR